MKCEDMEFLISLHADNLLTGDELKKLLEHFEECPECRNAYKDFLNLKSLLADSKPEINLDGSFENKVMKTVKNLNTDKNEKVIFYNPARKRKIFLLAASFLFAVISSAVFFTKSHDKKYTSYDFSWYYDISLENTDEQTSSSNSEYSLILNI